MKKNDTSVYFWVWKKWNVQSEATEVCEFLAKIPTFHRRLQLAAPSLNELLRRHSTRKVFPVDQWKTPRKLEWNSFLCFADDENNCRDPPKPQRKGENRTRRKLKLCYLNLYSNQPFSIVYSEQKVNFTALITLNLPHYIFNKRSYFGAAAGGGGGGG